MSNAELFKKVFGIYAEEFWAYPKEKMLDWLTSDVPDRRAGEWIPVTERLPKLDEDVLLCYIEYDRWHGQYVSVGQGKRFTFEWVEEGEDENEVEWEWVFANDLVHLVEVKYWMPLPEPPKGE